MHGVWQHRRPRPFDLRPAVAAKWRFCRVRWRRLANAGGAAKRGGSWRGFTSASTQPPTQPRSSFGTCQGTHEVAKRVIEGQVHDHRPSCRWQGFAGLAATAHALRAPAHIFAAGVSKRWPHRCSLSAIGRQFPNLPLSPTELVRHWCPPASRSGGAGKVCRERPVSLPCRPQDLERAPPRGIGDKCC